MHWDGKAIQTHSDLVEVMHKLRDAEQAQLFMATYKAVHPRAVENMSVALAFLQPAVVKRLQEWLGIEVYPKYPRGRYLTKG